MRDAIEQRLVDLRRRDPVPRGLHLGDIIVRGRARQIVDDRSDDEILGYGGDGMPA